MTVKPPQLPQKGIEKVQVQKQNHGGETKKSY